VNVHIVCMRHERDRILPRYSRHLRQGLGWTLSDKPDANADVNYYVNYADGWIRYSRWDKTPLAAHFTHKEEGVKGRLWNRCAAFCALRTVVSQQYYEVLEPLGPTVIVRPPMADYGLRPEHNHKTPRVGICGFGGQARKGGYLVEQLAEDSLDIDLVASGRGWPIPSTTYSWGDMEGFFHSLDVLLCTSLIDAGPAGPLEALRCGVSVVVPWGVGLMAELPEMPGLRHYNVGEYVDMRNALQTALAERPDREALRDVVAGFTVENWCADHERAFEEAFA